MADSDAIEGKNRKPRFFDVATDPCDNNPFPPDDPRHGIWRRTTRRAEEELSKLAEIMPEAYRHRLENEWERVKAELLKHGVPLRPIAMSPILVPFYQAEFDAWAWRNLAAIASDADLPPYDRWLIKHSENWLGSIEKWDEPADLKRPLIDDLQTALQGRIAHWKSEARKHLRSQEELGESWKRYPGAAVTGQEFAEGAMAADSAFWNDLETRFRALPDPKAGLTATFGAGQWTVVPGALSDELQGKRLEKLFRNLAERGAIAAGAPNGAHQLSYWLDLLRKESPHFQLKDSSDGAGWIEDVALAAAEYCSELSTCAFEMQTAAASGSRPRNSTHGFEAGENGRGHNADECR